MTIYDIKRATAETEPYFFSRDSMRFFKQTLKDFHAKQMPDGRFYIWAWSTGNHKTERYFNPKTNKLDLL